MPSNPFKPLYPHPGSWSWLRMALLAGAAGVLPATDAQASSPQTIRARQVEFHYRTVDSDRPVTAQLWYSRDRGATWQAYQPADPAANPVIFNAPAEGLYAFIMTMCEPGSSPNPPSAGATPDRWVFIDYTPPLAQWDSVEPGDNFPEKRTLQLRWTAYDDHLPSRPVALAYQSSVDGAWRVIDAELPNTGRYDWTLPRDFTGQLSLKLTVTDQGGHAVERMQGPLPLDRWLRRPAPTTRPALVASTRPAQAVPSTQPVAIDVERRLKAQALLRQGEVNLQRAQYAVASERFREALEADPGLVAALSNLANIHYLQEDYVKAVELYNQALMKDARNQSAMRGAALAYVAMRQYPQAGNMLQRLLTVNDKDAQAWLDLGDVTFMMGDRTRARSHWNRAMTVDTSAETVIRKAKRHMELFGGTGNE